MSFAAEPNMEPNLGSPTMLANEEADDDDDSSSAYGRAIRRIIAKSRPALEPRLHLGQTALSSSAPYCSSSRYLNDDNCNLGSPNDQETVSMDTPSHYFNQPDFESHSVYSINESDIDPMSPNQLFLQRLHRQFETSFTTNSLEQEASGSHNYQTNNYLNDDATSINTHDKRSLRRGTLLRSNSFNPKDLPSTHKTTRRQAAGTNRTQLSEQQDRLSGGGGGGGTGADSEQSSSELDTKWSWGDLKREFKLSQSESLFHLYQAKLQQSFFVALLILNIIFNVGAIVSYMISKYHEMNTYLILMRVAAIWVFVSFLVLIWFNKLWMQSKFSRTVASLAVLLAMIFGEASGAICALMNGQATPLATIRRTYYLIITNHVFLPFPTRIQSCAATIIITSFEIVVTYISRRDNNCRADYLTLYSIADIIFYASSAMIGFQITFLLEIAIRRTFLNHKYCIQSTYKLNYEKEQQEQLLRSCLPQHLIEEVRGDVRDFIARLSKRQSEPFRPFKHLYVKKYEDVTILYADIVNSMNLTDKLNPAELVETLNELYGRFDELAEKYSCLRIKLLGDCYYCVSGLPEYDEHHAMKCLLMGLGMIKIIQSIRQSRNVDIDMRIGIHSGSVLSGLIGLRKWQFDIWSLDAMKASQMEHSGQPGFVHITQRTLDLISKDHARRQDLIITSTRQSDDCETTYLISERVCPRTSRGSCPSQLNGQSAKLKAYIEKLRVRPTASAMDFTQRRMLLESDLKKYREIHEKVDQTMKRAIAEMPLGSAWKQFFFMDCLGLGELLCPSSRAKRSEHGNCDDHHERHHGSFSMGACLRRRGRGRGRKDEREFGLEMELRGKYRLSNSARPADSLGRERWRHDGGSRTQTIRPKQTTGADQKGARLAPGGLKRRLAERTAVKSPMNKALIQTDPLFHLYLICVGLITLSILAIKCLIPGMPIYTHTVIGFAFLLVIILVSTVYTQVKSKKINLQFRILLWLIISASLTMLQLVDLIVPDELDSLNIESITDITRADSLSCAFAWYYTYTIIVAMTATSIFIRINVWLKFIIHLSSIVFYVIINNPPATMMDTLREFLQTQSNNWSLLDHKQELSHLFYISMIAVILHLIDRQVEYILSLNIQWNEQLERDRIESQTVGQINKMLLENILPPHVLKRYLYNTTVNYDQLYHESLQSCAVMFASIPNYEQFYTENNLNEQGLECLRVLNEIICDFDQLLSIPCFRSIEKIKTIGSTYMAACSDVTRRTSDCNIEMPSETPHTAEPGLKTGWSNPLMAGESQSSPCSSPRLLAGSIVQHQAQNRNSLFVDEVTRNNVVTMVRFATALMEKLARMNKRGFKNEAAKDAWQDFRLRIGIAIGPVIAGVVGATKPTYDIWGDTVNVASRLESSGVLGRIQVSEQVAHILAKDDEYQVECRGPIEVKGKGRLTTYLVKTPFDSVDSDPGDPLYASAESQLAGTGATGCGGAGVGLDGASDEIPIPPEVAADDEVEELCANG